MTTTGTRPAWTLTEAVERTGASRSTLRRYRDKGKFPNAYKDTAGVWRFPLEDLLAVGLRPTDPAQREQVSVPTEHDQPPPEQPTAEQVSTALQTELETAQQTIQQMQQELAEVRQRAAVAEAVAAERERMIQTQAMALRMLEAGKPEHPEQPTAEHLSVSSEQPIGKPEQPVADTAHGGPSEPVPTLWRRLFRR